MHNFKEVIAVVIAVIITIVIIILLSTTTIITPLKAGLLFEPLLLSSNSIVYLGRGFSICSLDQIVGVIVQHLGKAGEGGSRKPLVLTDQSSPRLSQPAHPLQGEPCTLCSTLTTPTWKGREEQLLLTAISQGYWTSCLAGNAVIWLLLLPHSWCLSYLVWKTKNPSCSWVLYPPDGEVIGFFSLKATCSGKKFQ